MKANFRGRIFTGRLAKILVNRGRATEIEESEVEEVAQSKSKKKHVGRKKKTGKKV